MKCPKCKNSMLCRNIDNSIISDISDILYFDKISLITILYFICEKCNIEISETETINYKTIEKSRNKNISVIEQTGYYCWKDTNNYDVAEEIRK